MSHSEAKKVLKYVKKGSVSKLRSFMRKNDVNLNEIRNSKNRGLLHLSCYLGECKMTRFLLRHGTDPCQTDSDGNTPIHIALNYALEFNNASVFLNLIIPLKKKSKRIMHLRNKLGETPNELLSRLKKALREELSGRYKNGIEENEMPMGENKCGEDERTDEEREWHEKLAYEESCEDFYFKQDDHNWSSGEQDENYNEWAERIRYEYNAKHRKVMTSGLNTQAKEKQEHCMMNETLTRKLAKERAAYVNKVKQKQNEREKKKYEENCQNVLENGTTDELTFESIPWPCAGSAADIVDKLAEWAAEDKISYLKVQRVRWHPDRFAQRCRHRIKNSDVERITDLVKQISQGINVMISSL